MADEGFKRKLTTILSADAVEYSRLMAEDETATVKTIATYREVMTSLIKQHRGRVVDSPGDATATFSILRDLPGERVLSVSARNVPREFEVFYTVFTAYRPKTRPSSSRVRRPLHAITPGTKPRCSARKEKRNCCALRSSMTW